MGSAWQDGLLSPAYTYNYQIMPVSQWSFYWIGTVIGSTVNFATLSGTAVIIPFNLSSFFSGALAENFNRKWLVLAPLGVVSLMTFGYAFANSYLQMFGLTVVYGLF